jgi:hypothetical protein
MTLRRQDLRLALEPRLPLRIGDEGVRQQFQRDIPLQARIPRAIHLSIPPSPRRAVTSYAPSFSPIAIAVEQSAIIS